MIQTVGSSLDLERVLRGIVDIATDATACHACFIYFLDGERLVLRAASPRYSHLVGRIEMGIDQGLTGWVARTKTAEFLRENALEDPRMYYVPELEEERFQSMVAVPVLAKTGDVIGVIVLHTEAPREFEGEVLNFLVHTASLVGGAIENAQLYQETRRRIDNLTGLAELSQAVAAVTGPQELDETVTAGTRRLLGAAACHLYRLDAKAEVLTLTASHPDDAPPPGPEEEATALLLGSLRPARGARVRQRGLARTLLPEAGGHPPLIVPIAAGDERLGVLYCLSPSGGQPFTDEDAELVEAIANETALAMKKADLIERLTAENRVKDMFDALEAGSLEIAAAKATQAGVDLGQPHVLLHAEPAPLGGGVAGWLESAARIQARLRKLHSRAAFDPRHDRLLALVPVGSTGTSSTERLREACAQLAEDEELVVGMSEVADGNGGTSARVRQAADAARMGRSLAPRGGVVAYDQLGAYRYLVHFELADAPEDRYHRALSELAAYDRRRRTHLVETLERYLGDRCSVTASARALYVHPNTVRQRLDRIERITGLELAKEDLLSLELAVKLTRLQPAPRPEAAV
ncbi:MAG TPA: GAF domain-containing protein [Solirubrobacterales bacterium]|nr:GAF domain-containing protein [Solirubrobacterales bacterium]